MVSRTERRRQVTHLLLLDATRALVLRSGDAELRARHVAHEADLAVATFYNHFSSVAEAIEEALDPVRDWLLRWTDRILESDDFADALSRWVADYLRTLPDMSLHWRVMGSVCMGAVPAAELDRITAMMIERFGDQFRERGVRPGRAGELMQAAMVATAEAYPDGRLPAATARRVARVLHAAVSSDPGEVKRRAHRSVELLTPETTQ